MSSTPSLFAQFPAPGILNDPAMREQWARDVIAQLVQHHESIDSVNAALSTLAKTKGGTATTTTKPTAILGGGGGVGSSPRLEPKAGSNPYTVVAGDVGKVLIFADAAAIAITLPQAGVAGTGFGFSWYCYFLNLGPGTATITPTISTINGAATLDLLPNEGALVVLDGVNYVVAGFVLGAEPGANKDQPNGYPSLDADGKVPVTEIRNGVPAAGTTGQVLTKSSNTDYDQGWADPAAAAIPLAALDTDSTFAADSDTRVPSQKAVNDHVAAVALLRTSSAVDPLLADLPTAGMASVHKNTTSGNVFLAYNDGGTIRKLQLL